VGGVAGDVTFTYHDTNGAGDDTITASFTDGGGSLRSATAHKHWVGAPDTTKPSCGSLVVHRHPGGHDEADVTISDAGSGIASITNFIVTNGSASIPAFSPGAASVTVTAIKTVQGVNTHFEFDVTDVAGNTTHCV
jgi:hypothetical protein